MHKHLQSRGHLESKPPSQSLSPHEGPFFMLQISKFNLPPSIHIAVTLILHVLFCTTDESPIVIKRSFVDGLKTVHHVSFTLESPSPHLPAKHLLKMLLNLVLCILSSHLPKTVKVASFEFSLMNCV